MARTAKPWFRRSGAPTQHGWYVTVNGDRQALLLTQTEPAKDKNGEDVCPRNVHQSFCDLMARSNVLKDGDQALAASIIEAYAKSLKDRGKWHDYYARGFQYWSEFKTGGKSNGRTQVKDLKRIHLEGFLDHERSDTGLDGKPKKPKAKSTIVTYVTIIKGAFNWAALNEIISRNPFVAIPIGSTERSEAYVTKDDHIKLMLNRYKPDSKKNRKARRLFRLAITALYHTGCRPGELVKIVNDPSVVDLERGQWRLGRKSSHKTYDKTQEVKIIHLDRTMKLLCKILMKNTKPGERLFKHRYDLLHKTLYDLRSSLGLGEHVMPRGYRAALTTDLLENSELTDSEVANIMGWRNTQIIHKHYSHVGKRRTRLQTKMEEFAKTR